MPRKKSLSKPSAKRKPVSGSWFSRMAAEAKRSGFGFTLVKLPPGNKKK